MSEFRMPSLGADMETGTLLEWRVKPGDRVRRGDIVAVIDTDKAVIEVEIFSDGVVEQLLVEPGSKVPVGTVLAILGAADASPQVAAPMLGERPAPAAVHRPRASPLARRTAAALGVDLTSVTGTGEGGAITQADVELAHAALAGTSPKLARAHAGAQVVPPAPVAAPISTSSSTSSSTPSSSASTPPATALADSPARAAERALAMRRVIGAAMARSKREIPHYYLATRVDMSLALSWLASENARRPVTERLLPAALLLKATARAAREVPEVNGHFTGDAFSPSDAIHLGVAISLRPSGLVAPALKHADRLSLGELMACLRDLVRRARSGGLRSSELSEATLTVTNLGDQGVDTVFGVIHPPQVAMVGFGRIREEAWVENGMLGARPVVAVTLAADHRASDGHRGGLFLSALERALGSPETL